MVRLYTLANEVSATYYLSEQSERYLLPKRTLPYFFLYAIGQDTVCSPCSLGTKRIWPSSKTTVPVEPRTE